MLTNIGTIIVRGVLPAASPKRIYKKEFKKKKVVKNKSTVWSNRLRRKRE